MGRTGRVWHAVLWAVEIIAIVLVALLLMLPIQDYARREHLRWYLQPSVENWQAFQAKQREEFLVRLSVATPIAVVAVFLALRLRSKSRKTG
jgi:hypothetical protein